MFDACSRLETPTLNTLKGPSLPPPKELRSLFRKLLRVSPAPFLAPNIHLSHAKCPDNFGGRWFYQQNTIGVILCPDMRLTIGTSAHEWGHSIRWILGGDEAGEHDAAFYAVMEKLYPLAGVSVETALQIEAAPPPNWKDKKKW